VNITESAIKKALRDARADNGERKIFDSGGLYLFVRPNGSAAWRHKFNFGGKELLDTLARYPETPIKEARRLHQANRSLLDAGINPMDKKRDAKRAACDTFAEIAEQYIKNQEHKLAKRTISKARWQVRLVNPTIGAKPVTALTAQDVLAAIRKIEARGMAGKRDLIETAHKTLELVARVLDFAVDENRVQHNVARGRSKALKPRPKRHYPAIIEPAQIGALLRAIDGFVGQPATVAALRLLPHVFLRPGELRHGRWGEIDWDAAQWRVPGERMKMKLEHIVPLSKQSLAILKDLKPITGDGEFIFPAIGPKRRPISENTLGAALRSIGYGSDVMVPHGFRVMASTRLHDLGYTSGDVELQLAHADKNKVRSIYNRSERIKERTRMMQEWSDHVDVLRVGGNIVSITKKKHA
jgi:integrase